MPKIDAVYLPPVKVGHHDENPPKVGSLDLVRYDDKTGWLYADLLGLSEDVVSKYPYVSAEMMTDEPEVLALAMLGGTAPHHPIPPLDPAKAQRGKDGRLTFRSVPVFYRCAKGGVTFGDDYLKKALERHQWRKTLFADTTSYTERFARAWQDGRVWAEHFQETPMDNKDKDKELLDQKDAEKFEDAEPGVENAVATPSGDDRIAALEQRLSELENKIGDIVADALADVLSDEAEEAADATETATEGMEGAVDEIASDKEEQAMNEQFQRQDKQLMELRNRVAQFERREAEREEAAELAIVEREIRQLQADGHYAGEITPDVVKALATRPDRKEYFERLRAMPPIPRTTLFSHERKTSVEFQRDAQGSPWSCVTAEVLNKYENPDHRRINKA